MKDSHHKNYSDLSLDELEKLVEDLETMSIKALKERKKTLRASILRLEGDTESSRHWREQPDKFWSEKFGKPTTPRWVLQYFGTEVMRGQMYDGIWVDSCLGRYKGQNTVIADTRFPNEVKQIRERGGKIILVKRGPDPDWFVDYTEGNKRRIICQDRCPTRQRQDHRPAIPTYGC